MKYHILRPIQNPMKCGDIAILTDIEPMANGCIKGTIYVKGQVLELEWDRSGQVRNQNDSYSLLTQSENFKEVEEYLNCLIN